ESLLEASLRIRNPGKLKEQGERAIEIYEEIAHAYEVEAAKLTSKAKAVAARGDKDLADDLKAQAEAKQKVANERRKRVEAIHELIEDGDGVRDGVLNLPRHSDEAKGEQSNEG